MIVVSNTTPIISLYKIGELEILEKLFGQVIIPTAVYNEINVAGKKGHDILNTVQYIKTNNIQNLLAVNLLQSQIDYGEAEAIVLARELKADVLMLDEKKARKIARADSQTVIGTIGILQAAKNKGLISNMRTYLDGLITNGIWIDKKLYHEVLRFNQEK